MEREEEEGKEWIREGKVKESAWREGKESVDKRGKKSALDREWRGGRERVKREGKMQGIGSERRKGKGG